jgi:hypothetical protein
MAADLITLAEGALLTQFLTPTAKHYGEAALKRIQRLGDRAKAMLVGAGREPQGVEEKVLFPLVQAASLESDPTLAERWAALLANAADPAQKSPVQPRQLTPMDVRVLTTAAEIQLHPDTPPSGFISDFLLSERCSPLTKPEIHVITSNLTRLGLTLSAGQQDVRDRRAFAARSHYNTLGPGVEYIQLTPFCVVFLAAVTPPTL